ncbi:hypothetical protein [Marinicauda pacifica]|uniref:Oligosaccharide repeat unit polymerase n=1 Tax=Marinicauda pacifica TaxID=1133559 RepID=A0A4V3RZ71_9PROT|nr:hypothetical protein [Marinicauda pacifica]TGY93149.1 hypothetical protein E5162_08795 [Marinicauda pacifica]
MTYIALLLAILSIFVLLICNKRYGLISPSGMVISLIILNIIGFVLVEFYKIHSDSQIIHSYKFDYSYIPIQMPFIIYYSIALLFFIFISELSRARKQSPARFAFSIPRTKSTFIISFFAISSLLIVAGIHAIITDMSFLKTYNLYLQLRDPRFFNIDNRALQVIHGSVGFLGFISAGALFLSIKLRNIILVTMSIIVFSYFGAFQAASLSRWLALQIGFLVLLLLSDNKTRTNIITIIGLFAAPAAYFGAMNGRDSNDLGIGAFFQGIFSGASSDFFIHTIANIFGGGLVFSEAATRSGTTYPFIFKILSFSPLPSAIDNFQSVRAIHDVRINIFGPFSTYAELYWFDPQWLILFLIITGASLYTSQRAWNISSNKLSTRVLALLSFSMTVYGHLFTHQYPIRSSLRWIIIAGILGCISIYIEHKDQRSKPRPQIFR